MTKKFVLLQSRPETDASHGEYRSVLDFGRLTPDSLERVRLESGELPSRPFTDYAGIIMGGGPANYAIDGQHPEDGHGEVKKVIADMLDDIVGNDLPFLGMCLGIGAVVTHRGGETSYAHGEAPGAVDVILEPEARNDLIGRLLPSEFRAIVGHKEGVGAVPSDCVVLARSSACTQLIRVGRNVYATQYHPELDVDGLAARLRIYQHAGYCKPEEVEDIIAQCYGEDLTAAAIVLRGFVDRYSK